MLLLAVYLIDGTLFKTAGASAGRCAGDTYNVLDNGFWLDDVECHGNESSLISCPHKLLGQHDCIRGEIAEVTCQGIYIYSTHCSLCIHV